MSKRGYNLAIQKKKVEVGEKQKATPEQLRDAVKASPEQYEASIATLDFIFSVSLRWYKLAEARLAFLVAEIEHFGTNLNAHIEKISALAKAEVDEIKKANLEGHEAAWRLVDMALHAILERVKSGGSKERK